ncbi:MAG: hypothetical protein CMO81_04570 [Waddliaceae bacterium]|nr:hypothetical protein [Waddliaceae bacterium]
MIRLVRKSAISLIELMVGVALLSILLPLVLSYYSNAVLMSHTDKAHKIEAKRQYYLQERLAYFFSRTQSKDFHVLKGGEDQVLAPNLVFNYKGEADILPAFSGDNIIARLYVDESTGQLILIRWPKSKDSLGKLSYQKEVLLSGVKAIEFRMCKTREEGLGVEWLPNWEEPNKLPMSIELLIRDALDKETEYLFHFSSKEQFLRFEG